MQSCRESHCFGDVQTNRAFRGNEPAIPNPNATRLKRDFVDDLNGSRRHSPNSSRRTPPSRTSARFCRIALFLSCSEGSRIAQKFTYIVAIPGIRVIGVIIHRRIPFYCKDLFFASFFTSLRMIGADCGAHGDRF